LSQAGERKAGTERSAPWAGCPRHRSSYAVEPRPSPPDIGLCAQSFGGDNPRLGAGGTALLSAEDV